MLRWLKRLVVAVVASVALLGGALVLEIQTGNFHPVIAGELYRSAQPSAKDISRYAKEEGIKSIINLRGGNPTDDWYREELAASEAAGITHYDFRMKASRELTDDQAQELVVLMHEAPKPLLIHCKSGADRSGLAAALYLREIAGRGEEEARGQLSLRYGHMPYPWAEAQAMDRSYDRQLKLAPLAGTDVDSD